MASCHGAGAVAAVAGERRSYYMPLPVYCLCAMLDGLEEMVAQRTQVHTVVANPFANMALSSKVKPRQLTIDAPALMVACGLAMRRFDTA